MLRAAAEGLQGSSTPLTRVVHCAKESKVPIGQKALLSDSGSNLG